MGIAKRAASQDVTGVEHESELNQVRHDVRSLTEQFPVHEIG
jgi:hypothetical protein